MLRLLELSEDPDSFVSVHSFLTKYATQNKVNKTICKKVGLQFGKMVQALAKKDPALLFDTFTPVLFSLEGGGECQSKINWEKEIYRLVKKEGVDSKTILNLLIHRQQAHLIASFFGEYYFDFDHSNQLVALCNILSFIDNSKLRNEVASALIFNIPKEQVTWEGLSVLLSYIDNSNLREQIASALILLKEGSYVESISKILSSIDDFNLRDQIASAMIFTVPSKEATWDSVSLFASSFKDNSNAPLYAMLRLLELSEDQDSLKRSFFPCEVPN